LVDTCNNKAREMYAPCLTKSTESVRLGHISYKASLVFLDPMAKAKMQPYRIYGL
jgi:hypothetical protein